MRWHRAGVTVVERDACATPKGPARRASPASQEGQTRGPPDAGSSTPPFLNAFVLPPRAAKALGSANSTTEVAAKPGVDSARRPWTSITPVGNYQARALC